MSSSSTNVNALLLSAVVSDDNKATFSTNIVPVSRPRKMYKLALVLVLFVDDEEAWLLRMGGK